MILDTILGLFEVFVFLAIIIGCVTIMGQLISKDK